MKEENCSNEEVMVFYPTLKQLGDFPGYINYIESQGAHKAGIAKIIPPKNWVPRKKGYSLKEINRIIPTPIRQEVQGKTGLYKVFNMKQKSIPVSEFYVLAESAIYRPPKSSSFEDLERNFWRNIVYTPPIYGADVPGSLMDEDLEICNMNNLKTVLDLVAQEYGAEIAGVNTAYLYFGMWKSMFAWHTEDVDLYSINYLHFGAGKTWYVIPPEHGHRFERLSNFCFQEESQKCEAFLRHKSYLISPSILKGQNIPCNVVRQEKGDIVITFPFAYHAGFNHGYNIAESTNFASRRWIDYGKWASKCYCRPDSVKINMDTFIKHYQPEKYEGWLNGGNFEFHPENQKKRKVLSKKISTKKATRLSDAHKYFDPELQMTVSKKVRKEIIEITSSQLQPKVVVKKFDLQENCESTKVLN